MRRRVLAHAVFAAACARDPAPLAVPSASASHDASAPVFDASMSVVPCPAAAGSAPDVDRISGLRPVWRVELGKGATSGVVMDRSGPWIVPRQYSGGVAIDADTGGTCATIAGNAFQGFISRASGAVIVGDHTALVAIDPRTGAERWRRVVVTGTAPDYTLRDGLGGVASGGLDVVAFPVLRNEGPAMYHWEEHIVALDSTSGVERWRKLFVLHPPGKALAERGTIRLTGEATHVLVRTDDKLTALDAASGKEAWSVAWPASALVGFPRLPGSGKLPPLVAAADGRVALVFPGRIQLVDARTGAQTGEVALPGQAPTDVEFAGHTLVVALESTPGSASVIGVDATTAKTTWTHRAAYSVSRLHVEGNVAYVREGDGRIWALDALDGKPAWGMSTSAYDFAVTTTRSGSPRIALALGEHAIVAFDAPPAGTLPKPLAPYARWELDVHGDDCAGRSIAWIDGNEKVVWERPLPARLRAVAVAKCAELETLAFLRSPRAVRRAWYDVFGEHETDDSVVEIDDGGVLVLDKSKGAILLDAAVPAAPNGQALFFDDGTFELDATPTCKGKAAHGHLFAACGDRFVFFNGSTAMLLAAHPWRVEARGTYTGGPGGGVVHATIRIGARTLTIDGRTYMR